MAPCSSISNIRSVARMRASARSLSIANRSSQPCGAICTNSAVTCVAPVSRMRRREFWETAVALCAMPALIKSPRPTAIRVEDVTHRYQDFHYRAPYKFGGFAVDRVTLLNVECVVSLPNGHSAKGFGSMTMGNIWSFPSRVMTYDQTLGAMKALAGKISGLTRSYREYGHPIDLNFALEPYYLNAAAELTRDLHFAEPIPKLCTLVTA